MANRNTAFAQADSNAITVTIPADTQAGDQILARLSHATAAGTNAPQAATCSDAGFTLLNQAAEAAQSLLVETWTKIAQAGDAGKQITFTVPPGITSRTNIALGVYYNASTVKPVTLGPNAQDNGAVSSNPPFNYTFSTTTANLALGRPVTASSFLTNGEPAKVNNGVTGDGWCGAYSDPQWVRIDLGSVKQISQVVLRWETASAKAFEIQVSNDDTNWSTIYKTTTGPGGVQNLAVWGSGRYVRMYGTQRNTGFGYYLFEFEIYGPLDGVAVGGQVVLLGTAQTGSAVQWSTTVPTGLTYRGQANVSTNGTATGLADGPAPTTAGAKTYNWGTSVAANYITTVAAIPPPQGGGSVPVTVTLQASGIVPPTVGDADSATLTEAAARKQTAWWAATFVTGNNVPFDIFVDQVTGDAYVTEYSGHRITKITPDGVKTTFAGTGVAGFKDGSATTAQFNGPRGIARDSAGNFYVSDSANQRIRKIDPSGTVITIAGTGTAGYVDGPGASAQFSGPAGAAVDTAGTVYVTERDGNRVRKIDTAGNVTLVAGSTTGAAGTVNAVGSAARFNSPHNCRVSADGTTLYVADQNSNAIRKIDIATTNVITWGSMTGPIGVEIHPVTGQVYGGAYNAVRVFEVSATGTATAIAGTGAVGFVDNVPANNAVFNRPGGLAFTPDGSLLVADYGDSRIRRLTQFQSISGYETVTVTDAQTDPLAVWPDKGTFTESAQVFRALVAADTGTVAEAARFDDPNLAEPAPRFTGQEEHGAVLTSQNGTDFATVTVNPGEMLLVSFWGYVNGYVAAPTTLTGLGMTFKRFAATGGSGYTLSSFWGQYNGDVPLTGTLSVSGGGAPGPWSVVHVTGHNTGIPIAQVGGLTLAAPAAPSSRTFAVFGSGNTTAPGVRVNWQQASLGVASSPTLALGVHWRPDTFETTASSSNYGFGYAFEIQTAAFQVTDSDTATFTESQLDPAPIAADVGTVIDNAMVVLKGADTGKITETSVVSIGRDSWDTGVFDEAAIMKELPLADADKATVTEAASVVAAIDRADTGTLTDAATVGATVHDTDSGVFDDGQAASDGTNQYLAVGDAGVFIGEQAVLDTLVNIVEDADTGTFTESAAVAVSDVLPDNRTDNDTLMGAEGQTVRVTVADGDNGTFTDAQTDPVDAASQDWTLTDTATVTDKATHVGVGPGSDTATIADAESLVTLDLLGAGDTAAATDEVVLVRVIAAADTFSVVDQHSELFEARRVINDSDLGRMRDRLSILLKHDPFNNSDLEVIETAAFAEAESLVVNTADDDGAAFDEAEDAFLANIYLTGDDQATFTETQLAAVPIESTDSGVVDEAMILAALISTSDDQFTGDDAVVSVAAQVTSNDAGSVTDEASAWVELADDDTATLTDTAIYLGVPVTELTASDSGSVTEQASRAEFSRVINAGDTGHLVDTADLAVADAYWTLADAATGVDSETLEVGVSDGDLVATDETQFVSDGTNMYYNLGDAVAGADVATNVGVRPDADAAAVVEGAAVRPVDPLHTDWDRAYATEIATVHVWADDAGSVTDEISDFFETRRTIDQADTGWFRDRLLMLLMDTPGISQDLRHVDEEGIFDEATEALAGDSADADTGAGTDSQELFATAADEDTGAATETDELFAAPYGDDAARLVIEDAHVVELASPTVGQYGDDTATLAETPSPVIAQSVDDTALLADTPDAIVGPQDADTATVADDAVLVGLAGDDTGALADTDTPTIAQSTEDTGSLIDAAAQIGVVDPDTGGLTDTEAVFVALPADDLGAFDDDVAESSAQVPADDTGSHTDNEGLLAQAEEDDSGALTDAEALLATAHDADTATLADAEELAASGEDADTARFTEASVVRVELDGQTGLITNDSGLVIEDQVTSTETPADDRATITDAEELFVDTSDAEIGFFADDQALTVSGFADDIGNFAEAALLITDSGIGAFTGEDGRFTEEASLATWDAFAYPQDDEPITVVETQSVHRSLNLADYLDEKPGSVLKVNVITRQVDMSSYFDDDEYPISHVLPEQARAKLDAFAGNLAPPASFGDLLEDADFRYRYLSRWVTPNRRETGWYIVAWRRSPDGPIEWLA